MTRPNALISRHKLVLVVLGAFIAVMGLLPTPLLSALATHADASQPKAIPAASKSSGATDGAAGHTTDSAMGNTRVWLVRKGDTLSEIFESSNAPQSDLKNILAADSEYLALETLVPGSRLSLEFDAQDRFTTLTLHLDPARKVVFSRQPDGTFEYDKYEAETHWISEVIRGSISGSFYASAARAGLDRGEIVLIDQLLQNKLNFRRDLRAGDTFSAVVEHEVSGQKSTGNTRLSAISLERGKTTHYAFRFEDGNYYDENGNSVTPAFLRWPTARHYRVSSPFNPKRLHPITGRRSPHNGVDLAVPLGTAVVSTGDGVVRRVGNHPYAGRYVDIDHGGAHTTRYLHLSKVLVKRGARVQRGERIALSGNTGRSTGPHLHFELHLKGHPVNPLTADIPTAAAIPKTELAAFKSGVRQQLAIMKYAGSRSDVLYAKAPSLFD